MPITNNLGLTTKLDQDYWKIRSAGLWCDVIKVVHEVRETGSNHNVMSIMNDSKLKKDIKTF